MPLVYIQYMEMSSLNDVKLHMLVKAVLHLYFMSLLSILSLQEDYMCIVHTIMLPSFLFITAYQTLYDVVVISDVNSTYATAIPPAYPVKRSSYKVGKRFSIYKKDISLALSELVNLYD